MTDLTWKTGFEIELLAPRGFSRFDIADAVAHKSGGKAKRSFYHLPERDAEKTHLASDTLVLGYNAYDDKGEVVARFVDDLAIQEDLNSSATATGEWYRIVGNDMRLLDLIMEQCDAEAGLADVLKPVAKLYGVDLVNEDEHTYAVVNKMRQPIAKAISVPGERERTCEVISAPIEDDHYNKLELLVGTARSWGFSIPEEAAVHVHFDASRLKDAVILARLVRTLSIHGESLRKMMRTDVKSKRLGPIPSWLYKLTKDTGFQVLDWESACEAVLKAGSLTKNSDYNFINLIYDTPGKSTFEVRIFPGNMDTQTIIDQTALFEAILKWCVDSPYGAKADRNFAAFVESLSMEEKLQKNWVRKARAI